MPDRPVFYAGLIMLKHQLKMTMKRAVAGAGLATGIWRVANRLEQKGRITVLSLHCVGFPEGTRYLPDYMKLSEADFDRMVGLLARSLELISLKEALRRLEGNETGRPAVVITLDDGYRDNLTLALPILQKYGASATVFVEASAVDRRALTWIHKFFFIDRQKGSRFLAEEYARMTEDDNLSKRLRETILRGGNVEYEAKKILKYEADRVERERIFDEIFVHLGGDEKALLDGAYLSWPEVKALADAGVTIGCHTMSHPILSTLTKEEARLEIRESRDLIARETGATVDTFAYPWGRSWDYNDETIGVLKEEGFCCGLGMDHLSAFPGKCDVFRLSRYPVDPNLDLARLVAQCSGLYGWFGGKLEG